MDPFISSPSLTTLRDSLDTLLEDYLSALSAYQAAQATLHAALKDGYFHLARAKLALGPGRVSERSYDLGANEAQTIVTVSPIASFNTLSEGTQSEKEDGEKEVEGEEEPSSSALLGFSVGPRPTPAPPLETNVGKPPSSLSRRRPATPSSPPEPSTALDPPSPPAPKSPLHQFSPLPPPSLRQSASCFSAVVRASAAVVEAERRVRDRAREVKRKRREVERGERLQVGA
ncbi:hypothetical protein JCM11251_000366 [Rhodosporidiobolus azoricus]